jgi:MYXO-CTERM domain-containing protein
MKMGMSTGCVRAACVMVVAGCSGASLARPVSWSLAGDFSATVNPGAVWSYGQESALGVGYQDMLFASAPLGFDTWTQSASVSLPVVGHNATASDLVFGTAEVHANQVVLHPGPQGQYAVGRFTAPGAGTYDFSAVFVGEDFAFPTTTDVHVLVNDVAVFSADVLSFHVPTGSGPLSAALLAGDTIDVAVGFGPNGNYFGDTTGVEFVIESVPGPGAAVLLGLGGMAAVRRRRVNMV